jgi:hypothetical protein
MVRTLVLATGISVLWIGGVRADIPLPPDIKYVDPRVSFEGIDKYPDQVFLLRYLTFTGGPGKTPYSLVEVKDGNPFNLNAQRRLINVQLLTMKRDDYEKRAKDNPPSKWLDDKTEGVVVAKLATPPTTAPSTVKEAPVTQYRVEFKDGKLTAEKLEEKKGSLASPPGLPPVWAVGLVGSLCVASLGLWFVRRRG